MTITFIFNADTRGGCKVTDSWLNDATDSLLVDGLDWFGNGTVLPGSIRKMHLLNSSVQGVYTTTIYLKGFANDSVQWKYHAYSAGGLNNSGWETGSNRYVNIPSVDTTVVLPLIKPLITTTSIPVNYKAVISVDMNHSPINAYSKAPIPVSKIGYMAIYGDAWSLGGFTDSWNKSDSAHLSSVRFLNDSGVNGDAVPGDHIWTTTVTTSNCGQMDTIHYRFSCFYPGADSANNGVKPLDNEFGGVLSHSLSPHASPSNSTIYMNTVWGSALSAVKDATENGRSNNDFVLLQNYPNPFNPETRIQFVIPEAMKATVKVFDILGREIITLIDGEMAAGAHAVSFNGKSLQSGMYICRLQAGKYTLTKKMLLLK